MTLKTHICRTSLPSSRWWCLSLTAPRGFCERPSCLSLPWVSYKLLRHTQRLGRVRSCRLFACVPEKKSYFVLYIPTTLDT